VLQGQSVDKLYIYMKMSTRILNLFQIQFKNIKWKMNQSTKINLIGCDTIVNSPSMFYKLTMGLNFCRLIPLN
jgi:hypothetical protein